MKRFKTGALCVFCWIVALCGTVSCVRAQTAPSAATFDVETVKLGQFDPRTYGPHVSGDHASYNGVAVRDLITDAYDVKLTQVVGPDSINNERYDIDARMPDGTTQDEVKRMLQELLKRRFGLAFHIEKREATVYALVVDKTGSKLKPAVVISPEPKQDPDAPLKAGERYVGEGANRYKQTTNEDGSITTDMGLSGTLTTKSGPHFTRHWERSSITMGEFAESLVGFILSTGGGLWTVVDETGIQGTYQVAVDYKFGNLRTDGGATPDSTPFEQLSDGSLDQSLKALGLRMEVRKAPVDTYVVDHVERPSPN